MSNKVFFFFILTIFSFITQHIQCPWLLFVFGAITHMYEGVQTSKGFRYDVEVVMMIIMVVVYTMSHKDDNDNNGKTLI